MKKMLAIPAFICFLISFVVHTATYVGINFAEELPGVRLLPIWVIGFMFIMVASGANAKLGGSNSRYWWKNYMKPMPKWVRYTIRGFIAYAFINFLIIWFSVVGKGIPQRLNGEYAVYETGGQQPVYMSTEYRKSTTPIVHLNKVPVVRTYENGHNIYTRISEQEYYKQATPIYRGFTGHWMIFYLIPAAYFWYHK